MWNCSGENRNHFWGKGEWIIMRLFLEAVKCRLLPSIGWTACSVLAMFAGGLGGIWIGYLCLATGWMESTDKPFSGLAFLTFPCVGGAIGLAVMHIVRIWCWAKLHRRYKSEYEGWTQRHMMAIVLFDEAIWLVAFAAICTVLLMSL